MMTLLVTRAIINSFGSLVNDTFSNSKLIFLVITGFVCCNKKLKQLGVPPNLWGKVFQKKAFYGGTIFGGQI